MKDRVLIKEKVKCSKYLRCNVNKHWRSHSPAASSKNLTRPLGNKC